MALGTILSLLGSGIATGANIAKSKKEEKYNKELEDAEKKQQKENERLQRIQALTRYLGVGDEFSLLPKDKYKVEEPKKPYTSGLSTTSGMGGIISKFGPEIADLIANRGKNDDITG